MIESLADGKDGDFWRAEEGGSRVPGHKRQLTERQQIFAQHIFRFFGKKLSQKGPSNIQGTEIAGQDERGCPSATGYPRSTTTTEYQIAQHVHNEAHPGHYRQRHRHHHHYHHHHALQLWLKYPAESVCMGIILFSRSWQANVPKTGH